MTSNVVKENSDFTQVIGAQAHIESVEVLPVKVDPVSSLILIVGFIFCLRRK